MLAVRPSWDGTRRPLSQDFRNLPDVSSWDVACELVDATIEELAQAMIARRVYLVELLSTLGQLAEGFCGGLIDCCYIRETQTAVKASVYALRQ